MFCIYNTVDELHVCCAPAKRCGSLTSLSGTAMVVLATSVPMTMQTISTVYTCTCTSNYNVRVHLEFPE